MKKTNLINRTIIRALLPTVILLAACTADADYNDYADNAARSNASLKIYATIDNSGWGASTRADKNATSFANGDKIGVTISDKYSNKEYTYNDGTFTTTDGVYYENMYEKATAYYPYNENGGTISGEAQNFLYATSTEGSIFKDYNASSAPSINLTFKHAMARLKIKFQGNDSDKEDDQFVGLTVDGIKTTGTFNTQTGEAVATGSASTIEGTDGVALDTIVFPQTLSNGITVMFNLRGFEYTATINCEKFEAGKSYEYTVKYDRPIWFINASFARVGDYAGIHKDSNGNTDGKHFLASYAYEKDDQKDNVTGVIFWTSKQNTEEGLTMSQNESAKKTFKRGLIAKLETKDVVWQEKRNENLSDDNYGIISLASYINNYRTSVSIDVNSIQGYELTEAIRYYNIHNAFGGGKNDANCIKALREISKVEYSESEGKYDYYLVDSEIINDSKWYIPSIKELELLFKEYNATNSRIKSAFDAEGGVNGVYWSCTEGDNCGHDNHTITSKTTSGDEEEEKKVTYSSKVYVYDNSGTNVEKGKKQEDKFVEHTVIQVCAF
jgi:hypothetical protein